MTPEGWAAKTIHYGRPCRGPEGMGRELGLCAFCGALSDDFREALKDGYREGWEAGREAVIGIVFANQLASCNEIALKARALPIPEKQKEEP